MKNVSFLNLDSIKECDNEQNSMNLSIDTIKINLKSLIEYAYF